ncbi:MAG: HEAT repeat domain-containing protein, partial [Myxococcota bacterium]
MGALARAALAGTVLAALAGCPKRGAPPVDPLLPEQVDTVPARPPLEELRAGADNLDPGPRARALALLVEHEGPDPWARRALLDPSEWVRRAGIEALGARTDDLSRELLEGVVTDDESDPYLRALAALEAPGPDTAAAIGRALDEADEPWQIAPLAFAASRLGDEAAGDKLERALQTGELPLDLQFVEALGRSGDPAVAAALVQAQERVEE